MGVVCWFRWFYLADFYSVTGVSCIICFLLIFISTKYALRVFKVTHLLWNGVTEYCFI